MKHDMILEMEGETGQVIKLQITQKEGAKRKRKVKTWTSDQDDLLINLYQKHPKKWSCISSLMPQRNENQCLHRYRRLSQLGRQRKIWSEQEDETIKKLIKKVGKNWKFLSEMLGTKTGKQIRERYINKLDPRIKKQEWSEEEDLRLIQLYSEHGSRWSQIAKKLAGRPQNRIKNRFYSYIKRNYEIKEVVTKTTEAKPSQQPLCQPLLSKIEALKISMSVEFIRFGSEHHLQKLSYLHNENHQKSGFNSKMLLDGTEMLIREYRQPLISTRCINITSFTNFPEEDFIHYFDCRNPRPDSMRFLDTF